MNVSTGPQAALPLPGVYQYSEPAGDDAPLTSPGMAEGRVPPGRVPIQADGVEFIL